MSSAYDRPVRYLAIANNPWPYADALLPHGVEVMESDLAAADTVLFVDLDKFDEAMRIKEPVWRD